MAQRFRRLPPRGRLALVLVALLLGFSTYVWAQGVGIFTRSDCTVLTNPVTGQTFCFNQTQNGLSVYTGSTTGWLPVIGTGTGNLIVVDPTNGGRVGIGAAPGVGFHVAPTATTVALPNGANYTVNMFVNPATSGILNQAGAAYLINGGGVGGGISRIGVLSMAQSAGGAQSADQLEAANFVCQQNSTDAKTPIVCNEIDLNINGTDDVMSPPSAQAHYALSLVNAGGKIAGPAMLFISNAGGSPKFWRAIQIATASVNNGGYAFDYGGDGSLGPVLITTDSLVNVGNTVRNGVTAPSVAIPNNRYYSALNAAGTTHQPLIGLNSSNTVVIDLNANGTTFGAGSSFAGGLATPSGVAGGNKGTGTVNASGAPAYYQAGTAISTVTMKSGSGAGNYTTTSASYADIDGTNLAFTVTVPTGFKMLINTHIELSDSSLAGAYGLAITDGTSVLTEAFTVQAVAGDNSVTALTYVFTGDGSSHTFKLRWQTSAGTLTGVNSSSTRTPRITFLMVPSS